MFQGVQDLFTGADRTEFPDMEEFRATDADSMGIGAGYEVLAAISANEEEQANTSKSKISSLSASLLSPD